MKKLERNIEYFARLVVLASVIVLAIWTIATMPFEETWFVYFFLITFIIATAVVFYFEVRHLFRRQQSTQKEHIPAHTEQPGRNKWISIGLLVLVAIILVPIFARQLLPDSLEYQAFLTAFAATGAWVTGIAIVVFAYYQYKLRQTEHRLLFEPQILLTSGDISTTGSTNYPFLVGQKPFQIKWTVFIQNTSQIPMLIHLMLVNVRLNEKDSKRETQLTPTYCHIAEPENLSTPFEVSLIKSQSITWVIDGSAGDAFDYVSGDSNKRDFILIFKVFAERSQDPGAFVYEETTSSPIHVPQDANWVSKTPFLDEYKKGKETNHNKD